MPRSKQDPRVRKLIQAIELVQEVQQTLDTSMEPCSCCEFRFFKNWEETKMSRSLESAITRMNKAIKQI